MIGRPKRAWPYVTLELACPGAMCAALYAAGGAPWWVYITVIITSVVNNLSGWHEGQALERQREVPRMTATELAERVSRGERWTIMAKREELTE